MDNGYYNIILEFSDHSGQFRICQQQNEFYISEDHTADLEFIPEDANWDEYVSSSEGYHNFLDGMMAFSLRYPQLKGKKPNRISKKYRREVMNLLGMP